MTLPPALRDPKARFHLFFALTQFTLLFVIVAATTNPVPAGIAAASFGFLQLFFLRQRLRELRRGE